MTENARRHIGESLTIRWGTSRGADTYGYTTCSLRNNRGKRVASCNGGGYDMRGTVLGNWLAQSFPNELRALAPREFYGLCFVDPNYNPGKAVVDGEAVEQREKDGKSLGLERYQAFYAATSKTATERHTVPAIDGACGESSVLNILNAIGLGLKKVASTSKLDVYVIESSTRL